MSNITYRQNTTRDRERDGTSAMILYQAVMNDRKLQKQGGRITIAKADDASYNGCS